MKLVSVVGNRPQFIKLAPISWSAKDICEHLIINTGQHYDPLLSDVFFKELKISSPVKNLKIGSGTHSEQTGRMMIRLEKAFNKLKPDKVLVYGDTNSTLAAAICASKLNIPLAHIEAGLRSFNSKMPEEINRIIVDHISNFLFCPTLTALENLKNEGISHRSFFVGDLMYELLLRLNLQNNDSEVKNNRIFCTIHRSQNTDTPERLSLIIKKLSNSSIPIDLFAHPRLLARIKQFEIKIDERRIRIKSPVSYLKTIDLLKKYSGVITDSGGLQKEAFFLSVPCLTIRAETEWPETLKNNWNRLDNDLMFVNENWWEQLKNKENINEFGGKDTSKIILSRLLNS